MRLALVVTLSLLAMAPLGAQSCEVAASDTVRVHLHHPSARRVDGRVYPAELHVARTDAQGAIEIRELLIAIGPHDDPEIEAILATVARATIAAPTCTEPSRRVTSDRPVVASFRQLQRLVAAFGDRPPASLPGPRDEP